MLYVCVMDVIFFFLYCDAWRCRYSCMGGMTITLLLS